MHYNYFRDYNPAVGRYAQSDPIGLKGGLNTFGYVGGEPNGFSDPQGLERLILFNQWSLDQKTMNDTKRINRYGPDYTDTLIIYSHGSTDGAYDSRCDKCDVNPKLLSLEQLVVKIKSSGKWKPGQPIVLFACNTGEKDFAQKLSNMLNTKIYAPQSDVKLIDNFQQNDALIKSFSFFQPKK